MTDIFDNTGIIHSAVETLVDAVLDGGATFLEQVKSDTDTFLTNVMGYVDDDTSAVEAYFDEMSIEAPAISEALPDVASLSTLLKSSGLAIGLLYATTEIADSDDPSSEAVKQPRVLQRALTIFPAIRRVKGPFHDGNGADT